mmetsp:Transcript_52656/g.163415  ORF Transcript_52656/g.163415 Transcript_52656/m.163415 type:complete len:127 (+) Transcript_52656:46-426(+)
MKAFDALIPTRFMASICFLISVMMVFSTMADNIIVSLPSTYSQTSYDSYKSSLNLVLSLHIICICFNLAGLLQLPTESDRLGDILVPQVSCLGSRCSFHRTRSLSSSLIQLDAFTLVWPSWKHGIT